jgi:hypothetical protein
MKYFKTRFLVLCGLTVLTAAFMVPAVTEAQCPLWVIDCGNSHSCSCAGTPQGTNCVYDMACINGGCCKSDVEPIDYAN